MSRSRDTAALGVLRKTAESFITTTCFPSSLAREALIAVVDVAESQSRAAEASARHVHRALDTDRRSHSSSELSISSLDRRLTVLGRVESADSVLSFSSARSLQPKAGSSGDPRPTVYVDFTEAKAPAPSRPRVIGDSGGLVYLVHLRDLQLVNSHRIASLESGIRQALQSAEQRNLLGQLASVDVSHLEELGERLRLCIERHAFLGQLVLAADARFLKAQLARDTQVHSIRSRREKAVVVTAATSPHSSKTMEAPAACALPFVPHALCVGGTTSACSVTAHEIEPGASEGGDGSPSGASEVAELASNDSGLVRSNSGAPLCPAEGTHVCTAAAVCDRGTSSEGRSPAAAHHAGSLGDHSAVDALLGDRYQGCLSQPLNAEQSSAALGDTAAAVRAVTRYVQSVEGVSLYAEPDCGAPELAGAPDHKTALQSQATPFTEAGSPTCAPTAPALAAAATPPAQATAGRIQSRMPVAARRRASAGEPSEVKVPPQTGVPSPVQRVRASVLPAGVTALATAGLLKSNAQPVPLADILTAASCLTPSAPHRAITSHPVGMGTFREAPCSRPVVYHRPTSSVAFATPMAPTGSPNARPVSSPCSPVPSATGSPARPVWRPTGTVITALGSGGSIGVGSFGGGSNSSCGGGGISGSARSPQMEGFATTATLAAAALGRSPPPARASFTIRPLERISSLNGVGAGIPGLRYYAPSAYAFVPAPAAASSPRIRPAACAASHAAATARPASAAVRPALRSLHAENCPCAGAVAGGSLESTRLAALGARPATSEGRPQARAGGSARTGHETARPATASLPRPPPPSPGPSLRLASDRLSRRLALGAAAAAGGDHHSADAPGGVHASANPFKKQQPSELQEGFMVPVGRTAAGNVIWRRRSSVVASIDSGALVPPPANISVTRGAASPVRDTHSTVASPPSRADDNTQSTSATGVVAGLISSGVGLNVRASSRLMRRRGSVDVSPSAAPTAGPPPQLTTPADDGAKQTLVSPAQTRCKPRRASLEALAACQPVQTALLLAGQPKAGHVAGSSEDEAIRESGMQPALAARSGSAKRRDGLSATSGTVSSASKRAAGLTHRGVAEGREVGWVPPGTAASTSADSCTARFQSRASATLAAALAGELLPAPGTSDDATIGCAADLADETSARLPAVSSWRRGAGSTRTGCAEGATGSASPRYSSPTDWDVAPPGNKKYDE